MALTVPTTIRAWKVMLDYKEDKVKGTQMADEETSESK